MSRKLETMQKASKISGSMNNMRLCFEYVCGDDYAEAPQHDSKDFKLKQKQDLYEFTCCA